MFFILTSYFFFLKQNRAEDDAARQHYLRRYMFRNLKLYAFWFVVLLPFTIIVRKWYISVDVINVIRSFFLGSTFLGSWFIMASLLSVALVWVLAHWLSDRLLLFLGIVCYAVCCLSSSYAHVLAEFDWETLPFAPHNSFMVAILFVVIGKVLAEKHLVCKPIILWVSLCIGIVLLYVEWKFSNVLHLQATDDCFMALAPISIAVFMLVGQTEWGSLQRLDTTKIRNYSIMIYCLHISIGPVIAIMLTWIGLPSGCDFFFALKFLVTLTLSILISASMLCMEQRWPVLKNAH